jgi:non-ribosomal peptide synthetase-like protein
MTNIQGAVSATQVDGVSEVPIASRIWPRSIQTLQHCFERTCDEMPGRVAVEVGPLCLTYQELDRRANQLAHLLLERGVGGSRVGILLERSVETYVAMLGVLKSGAAYVPLDPSFPDDRLAYIVEDAGLGHLLAMSASRERTQRAGCPVLELDLMQPELDVQCDARPRTELDASSLCYVIYTSGSTGKPKGVAVSHASIVNFLRVATPIYAVTSDDRVYQGMSISFDFHLEEIWPAWAGGATVVAGPTDSNRFGQGLAEFLAKHRITVFCSVPTLLTTVESELPSVRLLLVSGEAMPPDLVTRFSRPDRRVLNCYGPTETTVSSSCAELSPDCPVTLGVPFPTYEFYVLDDGRRPVPPGRTGEIWIGGPGVAVGYLNRPDLTAERFVPNPIAADRRKAPRIYRTGDLGRRTPTGEFEYLGRIDTQVKVRGYRIELCEIEQVIREDPAVENVVVVTSERGSVVADLVGYVTLHEHGAQNASSISSAGGEEELRERLHTMLRRRLPPYMIPSYIEVIDRFPLLAADKVDRTRLPAPASAPLGAGSGPYVPAETDREAEIATTWGEILGLDRISVEDDFFCDLGGHSLTAARVISALRERPGLQGLSMGDLYANPTVRDLAEHTETALFAPASHRAGTIESGRPAPLRHSNLRVMSCGVAQLTILYLWLLALGTPVLVVAYAVELQLNLFQRYLPREGPLAVPASLGILPLALLCVVWFGVVLTLLPIVGTRLVMRGVRPGWYPLWGRTYLRFWFLGKVLALSPLGLFAGSPMLPPYLRLLGAKVGERCQLATGQIAVPQFLEIGDGTSIGLATRVQPYVVQDGWLRLGPIRIGTDSFVGNNSLILPGAQIGDRASVGDQSLVHSDHLIPSDEHWAGSPIARQRSAPPLLTTLTERADDRPWRRSVLLGYAAGIPLLRLLPLLMAVPSIVVMISVTLTEGIWWGAVSSAAAAPLYVLFTCVVLVVAKRAALSRVEPGVYPCRGGFGLRQWFSNHIVLMSVTMIQTVYCTLYAIPFLRRLGLQLGRWSEVATPTFIDPDTTVIGDQTFLAGGVVTGPSTYHRGCIAVATAEMDSRSFLGNEALLPCGSRMGENSLLGVFSMPPARPMDPETTWLGSPAFFLPRRESSRRFPAKYIDKPTPALIAGRLAIEYFRVALPEIILLLTGLLGLYVLDDLAVLVPSLVLIALLPVLGWALGLADTLVVVLLKWIIMGRYRPRTEPYWGLWVRGTELVTGLFEAVAVRSLLNFLTATPWVAPVLRLFGTHIGRRVWLNSTSLTEFDLVHIGDDAAVGEQGDMLTHLFEDRVMKMSHVRIGAGATVGTRAVVLYDAEVGAGSFLDAYSLAMKSEVLPPQTRWRGIPARPL